MNHLEVDEEIKGDLKPSNTAQCNTKKKKPQIKTL